MAKTWALAEYCEGDMYVSLHSTYRSCLLSLANDWLDDYTDENGEVYGENSTDEEIHSAMEQYREEVAWLASELDVPDPDESPVWNTLGRVEALAKKWESSGDSASMAHAVVLKAVLAGTSEPVVIPNMSDQEAKGFLAALGDFHQS